MSEPASAADADWAPTTAACPSTTIADTMSTPRLPIPTSSGFDFGLQLGDALVRLGQIVALPELVDELFVVGKRLGLLFRVALDNRLGKIEVDGVAIGELRILLQHRLEAIHGSRIPPVAIIKVPD